MSVRSNIYNRYFQSNIVTFIHNSRWNTFIKWTKYHRETRERTHLCWMTQTKNINLRTANEIFARFSLSKATLLGSILPLAWFSFSFSFLKSKGRSWRNCFDQSTENKIKSQLEVSQVNFHLCFFGSMLFIGW